jgi:hypothetical protein
MGEITFIRVIKPRRFRWEGHTARMGKIINAYTVLVVSREE